MGKSKSPPDGATVVTTYSGLEKYAEASAAGHLNLLVITGDPGLAKSRTIRQALGQDVCWIDGNATPFGIYMACFESRGKPLVLDDVDGLYSDRNGVRLLKSLGQSEELKSVSWETASSILDKRGIPRQFTTTSRVVIIANEWKCMNADVAALNDRGHLIHFAPGPLEVHLQASTWFWDQQVFDVVAANLHLVERHSLRTYTKAAELKQASMDWKEFVLSRCLSGTPLEVARLKADPSFATEKERVEAFIAAGHGNRATYYNHLKRLKPTTEVPPITLVNTSRPEPAAARPEFDLEALLRERFGQLGSG